MAVTQCLQHREPRENGRFESNRIGGFLVQFGTLLLLTEHSVSMNGGIAENGSSDTQSAIMDATYRALVSHGYADLSISKIADEFEKSKSLLYYHYEDKDELLIAFLEHITEHFSENISVERSADPEAQLRSFFDRFLPPTLEKDQREIQAALFEMRAQAPHHEEYREQFTRTDNLIRETIVEYIQAGIDRGDFREDVAPEAEAQLFLSLISGAMLERITSDVDDPVTDLRAALDHHIEASLKLDESE